MHQKPRNPNTKHPDNTQTLDYASRNCRHLPLLLRGLHPDQPAVLPPPGPLDPQRRGRGAGAEPLRGGRRPSGGGPDRAFRHGGLLDPHPALAREPAFFRQPAAARGDVHAGGRPAADPDDRQPARPASGSLPAVRTEIFGGRPARHPAESRPGPLHQPGRRGHHPRGAVAGRFHPGHRVLGARILPALPRRGRVGLRQPADGLLEGQGAARTLSASVPGRPREVQGQGQGGQGRPGRTQTRQDRAAPQAGGL